MSERWPDKLYALRGGPVPGFLEAALIDLRRADPLIVEDDEGNRRRVLGYVLEAEGGGVDLVARHSETFTVDDIRALLTKEQRERLESIAEEIEFTLESHQPPPSVTHADAAFLRGLATEGGEGS